jgi:antitoxin component YwqK of YwqJK toxin-antitoxin module
MVGTSARLIVALAFAAHAAAAIAENYDVRGSCRDGYVHGVYELRGEGNRLRVQGAFNRGLRTSSFLYWTSTGIRVAHVPYDEGAISGTVAMWYEYARAGREPQQKLEAAYANGERHGITRSWFSNGRPRGEYGYERGVLVAAKAWNALSAPLSADAARAQAARDADEDKRYYASLDAIVDANLPACEPASAGGTKS